LVDVLAPLAMTMKRIASFVFNLLTNLQACGGTITFFPPELQPYRRYANRIIGAALRVPLLLAALVLLVVAAGHFSI
jgi:hypothetical protein